MAREGVRPAKLFRPLVLARHAALSAYWLCSRALYFLHSQHTRALIPARPRLFDTDALYELPAEYAPRQRDNEPRTTSFPKYSSNLLGSPTSASCHQLGVVYQLMG